MNVYPCVYTGSKVYVHCHRMTGVLLLTHWPLSRECCHFQDRECRVQCL